MDVDNGLFGDSSDDEPKKNKKQKQHREEDLYSGSNDSDVDRPPLTEADRRRQANRMRSKMK